jgi:hypothetical protein
MPEHMNGRRERQLRDRDGHARRPRHPINADRPQAAIGAEHAVVDRPRASFGLLERDAFGGSADAIFLTATAGLKDDALGNAVTPDAKD